MGGQFNPVGTPPLYTSKLVETAWLEAQQAFPFKAQPMTICANQVDCADVADLTNHQTGEELAVDEADLACPREHLISLRRVPPSWQLTRRLINRGIAAVIVPSYPPGTAGADRNVVFWHWSEALPNRVVVIDDGARLRRRLADTTTSHG